MYTPGNGNGISISCRIPVRRESDLGVDLSNRDVKILGEKFIFLLIFQLFSNCDFFFFFFGIYNPIELRIEIRTDLFSNFSDIRSCTFLEIFF